MYEPRAALADVGDLNQGDLVARLIRPLSPTGRSIAYVRSKTKVDINLGKGALSADPLEGELRVVCRLERLALAIVLSNSCDNAGGGNLLLAPVVPFAFSAKAVSPSDRWMQISTMATGLMSRFFYLPAEPTYSVARSKADLIDCFSITNDFARRCVSDAGMSRLCGLSPSSLRHLQWAFSVSVSRNSRDDLEWPSLEDLELKTAWLQEQIGKAEGETLERYRDALGLVEAHIKAKGPAPAKPA